MGSGVSLVAITAEGTVIPRPSDPGTDSIFGLQNQSIIATGAHIGMQGHLAHRLLIWLNRCAVWLNRCASRSDVPHQTAVAPSSRAHEVAGRLSQAHNGIESHVIPLPSVDIISALLRRDLDSVRTALMDPGGSNETAVTQAMGALPRARRLAALLESLVPLLTSAAAAESAQQTPALKKAPKAAVEKLPSRNYKAVEGVTRECYICLDTYEDGDHMRRLPCRHEFHSKCVDRWLLEVHRTCPCCRADVCLGSDSEEEVHEQEAGTSTRLPSYDELRPTGAMAREGAIVQNSALSDEQAALQMQHLESRNTLSHSISQLQMLRRRQASLTNERERLQEIHNDLCETRSQLRSELNALRSSDARPRPPPPIGRGSVMRASAPSVLSSAAAGTRARVERADVRVPASGGADSERALDIRSERGGQGQQVQQVVQRRLSNHAHSRRNASPSSSDDDSEDEDEVLVSSAYSRHVRTLGRDPRPGNNMISMSRASGGPAAGVADGAARNTPAAQRAATATSGSPLARCAANNLRGNERARDWLARDRPDVRHGGGSASRDSPRAAGSFTPQRRASGGAGAGLRDVLGDREVPISRFAGGSWRYARLHGVR